ncbi:MAG TPA: acetoacetate decarboxylase family protein [Acidimicrobiales bacterium]|nr:acetoacetate decarboxylase family protein [Acidimicrobiales bacterium]
MTPGPPSARPPAIIDPASGAHSEASLASPSEPSSWEVLGRRVSVPVEVRRAGQWSVQYLVPSAAAQRLVDPTGLTVTGPLPGKALVAVAVCRYDDTDLDPYHEVAMSFVVRAHDAPAAASGLERLKEFGSGAIGVYIHRLPVDQEFSCAAGRDIWGFPKWVASIDIDEPSASDRRRTRRSGTTVRLVDRGRHVLSLTVTGGGRLQLPAQAPPTYSFRDGVLRRTTWTTSSEGVSGRLGGATLVLGNHPMADELRSLGLPKRALFSSSAALMRASFDRATVVQAGDRSDARRRR